MEHPLAGAGAFGANAFSGLGEGLAQDFACKGSLFGLLRFAFAFAFAFALGFGTTSATIITSCRSEGLHPEKIFLGLSLTGQRDILLVVVEEPRSRASLEEIATVGAFDKESGSGIAFQIDIVDVVGLSQKIAEV